MISAATRLSEQPSTIAVGACPAARLARWSTLWLGCSGLPATNRSLPSLRACQAFAGEVWGMLKIVPDTMAASELLGWYDGAARDLPWRRPGVTAWQVLVSEFMLQQTPVNRVQPVWEEWVRRWPTPSATAAASAADVLRA